MANIQSHLRGGRVARLIEFQLDPRASDPGSLTEEGLIWVNTTTHRIKYFDGTVARSVIVTGADFANGDIPLAKLATDPLARANHTGTQAASTISDFDTQVRTNRLDQMTAPTAAVSFGAQRITNLAEPSAGTDAATKQYVDNAIAGLAMKDSVRVATTAALTLASQVENGDTIDGVTLATGDRVLIKNQATASENGIYTVNASGAPTRATDFDLGAEVLGAATFVEEGTTNGGTLWVLTTDAPITIGSTNLSFSQFSGGTTYTAGNGLTLTGGEFAVGAGTGISVSADAVAIDTTVVARFVQGTFDGDGSTTSFAVTHNLNKPNPLIQVWDRDATPQDVIIVDLQRNSDNATNVVFVSPPANGATYAWIAVG